MKRPGRVCGIALLAPPHTRTEDAAGLLTGAFLASLGLFALDAGGVTTGGTAGLALLLTHTTSSTEPVYAALVGKSPGGDRGPRGLPAPLQPGRVQRRRTALPGAARLARRVCADWLDGAVVLASAAVSDLRLAAAPAAGAVLLDLVIAMNHRPGRYVAS